MALWEDSAHNIWIGTWEKGLWKLNPHTRQVEKYLTGEKGEGILHIHSILEYSPELLFIGSDDGLTIFNTVTLYLSDAERQGRRNLDWNLL